MIEPNMGRNQGTDRRRLKIAVFGVFGAGNLGNDCTLYAMLYNLRKHLSNALFCCICSGPEETASRHSVVAFPIREGRLPRTNNVLLRTLAKILLAIPLDLYRWFKVISILKGHDMLIMTGTGMLSDLGIVPFGLHYDIVRWSLAAKLCRCKLLFVSVGVGPIRHPWSRLFVKAALGVADFRSYRDSFSWDYLESISFKRDQDSVFPDLAFSLPQTMTSCNPKGSSQRAVIGLGLITHSRKRSTSENVQSIYQDYITKVAALVGWLLERNYTVQLLIGDIAYDERARKDLIAILEEDGRPCEETRIVNKPTRSVEELLSQLATTDVVIASRFHNVLLALMLNKPVVAISFHEKVDSLMSALGLDAYCQDIENIDLERLTTQLAALEANAEPLRLQIEQKTEIYRRALDRQYQIIFKMLGIPAPAMN